MSLRRYCATTLPALADHVRAGQLPVPADAVLARDESEDAEYEALVQAADASAALVAGLPDGQRRRVVVVTEATSGELVPLSRVLSVHADATDDADPDEDLGWYATQELEDLLAGW
jgi:hypothetical protein